MPPDAPARDYELAHERHFLDHDLTVFGSAEPHPDPARPWDYILRDPADAEQKFLAQPLASLKKIALARTLQLHREFNDELRDHLYNRYTVPELLSMLAGTTAVPALPHPAPGRWACGRARA